jgi:hypothetical protein
VELSDHLHVPAALFHGEEPLPPVYVRLQVLDDVEYFTAEQLVPTCDTTLRHILKVKVKQSCYMPGVAQKVPGS